MKRNTIASLSLLTAIPLVGLSTAIGAEEMYLVRDGIPIEKNIHQTEMDVKANPFWSEWTQRKGHTVDGRFVLDRRDKNQRDFPAPKSALGDCEFDVCFSVNPAEYGNRGGGRGPWIRLKDRGPFGFLDKGRRLSTSQYPGSLPLDKFDAASPINLGDGKLHTMTVKRVGDVLSFFIDGEAVTQQKIDPKANLIFNLCALESYPRVASIRFTADKFSDSLSTEFKSAAPIEVIFDGTGEPQETVVRQSADRFSATRVGGRDYSPGRAAVYRIPSLVLTNKGTLLAFAEARASGFDWGHIRLVVRRSEDNWRGVTKRKVPRSDEPFPTAPIVTQTAEEAYKLVLAKAGAIYPKRDAVDTRIVGDVKNRTRKIINSQKEVGGYPELKTYDIPTDSDHDGMPDDWETRHGLLPNDAADGAREKDSDGYTNLEEYLNKTDPTKFVDYRDRKHNVHTYH